MNVLLYLLRQRVGILFVMAAIGVTCTARAGTVSATTNFSVSNLSVTGVSAVDYNPWPAYLEASAWSRTTANLGTSPVVGTTSASSSVSDSGGSASGSVNNAFTAMTSNTTASVVVPPGSFKEALQQNFFVSYVSFDVTAGSTVTLSYDASLFRQRDASSALESMVYSFNWFRIDLYDNNGFLGRWAPGISAGAPGFEDYWDVSAGIPEVPDGWYLSNNIVSNVTKVAPFSLNIFEQTFGPGGPVTINQTGMFSLSFTALTDNHFEIDLIGETWSFASAVPLPAAVWQGLLLLGLGAAARLRYARRA